MSDVFDLIVLGGGPAGYCAAERAGAAGMRVLLLEKASLGGVCLNEGCIPSKTLLNSAKALHYAKDSKAFGVTTTGVSVDVPSIIERKRRVVRTLVSGVAAKMKKHSVTVLPAEGVLQGKIGDAFAVASNGETHIGKRLLLATGSAPAIPGIPSLADGLQSGFVWTSRQALEAEAIPPRLVVIGGGVIGLEMASYYRAMGSIVDVIEMLPAIGGMLDEAVSGALLANLKAEGICFHLNARVTAITADGVQFVTDAGENTLPADRVLLSIGRRPAIEGYGLETLHIDHSPRGIAADETGRTSHPGVYAAGDVNGRSMLAHTAYREAECAVSDMLGQPQRVDYDAIPAVLYTSPEVACAGLTLDQAESAGYDVQSVTLPMAYSGRYIAETAGGEGLLRLIADRQTRRLLGVHMISPYASEIIYGASMMLSTRLPVEALRRFVFPHPTVGEVLREALWEI